MASNAITTVEYQSISSISTVHLDIIQTHILTRLDGPALAATACTSSYFRSLTSSHEKLWQEICTSTFPSMKDPRLQNLISTFPCGHRSLFSDSFPVLDHHLQRPSSKHSTTLDYSLLSHTTELISAVDIFYENNTIFSKVEETETITGWFQFPPFRIDLLDEKELVPTPISFVSESEDDILLKRLEEKLSLSWIIIIDDSSQERKAVNLSSRWPVSVERHWLTRDVHMKYAVVVVGGDRRWPWGLFSTTELVECEIMVTLGGKEGGEMYVEEVTMQMKDMEGKNLCGRDSLVILHNSIVNGKRKRAKIRDEGKHKYEEFLVMKREKKHTKLNIERVLNIGCFTGFIVFCSFKLFSCLNRLLSQ
ncbi:hypothetical protein Dsin_027216 [Dipteronia sinensis]|uniref:F-box domain-containing protein n=1 Tax=Dipteronia sinensis TaxID=43782 RepID=A0AAD9ZZR5_9ROSI|nr:hypothetical protein Dsin_027216 [Dipteronia sinensis]